MMNQPVSRRTAMYSIARAAGACVALDGCTFHGPAAFQVAAFRADVTPPLGYPLLGGLRKPALRIEDPLYANGLVLLGTDAPLVIVAIDWCEIRNDAYERWRSVLAKAAGTARQRVLVSCVHQHDAPHSDWRAQQIFEEYKIPGRLCDPRFEEQAIQKVAAAVREGLKNPLQVSHIGTGQAKVEQVASNRRVLGPDGKYHWSRMSTTVDPTIRNQPEGVVDPWLKTISFWHDGRPVAAIHCYAVHAQSHYGEGDVSSDFLGAARALRQRDDPTVRQIFLAGCCGDVIVGKYNDGKPETWRGFSGRIHAAMLSAWKATERRPLRSVGFRCVQMRLQPRRTPGYSVKEFRASLADPATNPVRRWESALGLSWLERVEAGRPIDVPVIDFGPAQLVLMPGETFVEYQLRAQKMRPDSFVMVAGFGESAPGYIPTAQAAAEGYDDSYSWIAFPECEQTMISALQAALRAPAPGERTAAGRHTIQEDS